METICQDNPKVSIITPVYGVEKYIKKCAESLFSQTYDNCEFVFVNDCTKDRSMELLREVIVDYPHIQNKIRIINHDFNKGLACARNTGVKGSVGDYLMHVDSDDTIEPETVALCVKTILEEKADAVIFGFKHIKKSGTFIENVFIPSDHITYIKQLIARQNIVCMCGGLYKRTLYTDYDVWAIPGLNMGEDYSTKPRLLYNAVRVVALNFPLYNYNHLNDDSYTQLFTSSRVDDVVKSVSVLSDYFNKCEDSSQFRDSLKLASLSSKLLLLKSWAVSKSSPDDFEKIRGLYLDIKINILPSFVDRCILNLAKRNRRHTIRMIVMVGVKIKNLLT